METSLRQGPLSAGTHSGGGLTPASAGRRPVSGDKPQTRALVRGHTLRRGDHTASAGLRPVSGDKPQTRALLFRALNTYSA